MKNALDQKHAVQWVRYLWIFPRHLIACHTTCWWQSCMHTDYPPPPAAYSVITWVGAGSGWKYLTPEVPGKLLPKVSPRVLSWVPCFLTFSSTTCFILWKNVRCIIMQMTILCQTELHLLMKSYPIWDTIVRYPYADLTRMVWKQIPINFSFSYLRHVKMKV